MRNDAAVEHPTPRTGAWHHRPHARQPVVRRLCRLLNRGGCTETLRQYSNVRCGVFLHCQQRTREATRTWVSGVGDDANPCSRTAPCKTFQGAISKTAAHGEMSVLDPGGYGPVTITKSITLSGSGTLASIVATGTGITITAGANDVVVVHNIQINGIGASTGAGIRLASPGTQVVLENVVVQGFDRGI